MCFSATASFTASSALIVVTTLIFYQKKQKLLLLALFPLFFALQQFSEGVLWLYLPKEQGLQIPILAKNVFLFFAFVFWPIWFPFSFWFYELKPKRKGMIALCLGIGIALGCSLLFFIPTIEAIPYCFSIHYKSLIVETGTTLATLNWLAFFFFGIATLAPLFFTSLKNFWILGLLSLISAIAIFIADQLFFVSLWCFYAAVLSIGLLFLLPKKQT